MQFLFGNRDISLYLLEIIDDNFLVRGVSAKDLFSKEVGLDFHCSFGLSVNVPSLFLV